VLPQVGKDIASDTVYDALKAGYRLLDGESPSVKVSLSRMSSSTALPPQLLPTTTTT
jgi:hypothetical protein